MRTALLTVLFVAASGLAACDFTPTLDIETPEYVAGVAVRGFLVADSVALVRLGESWNPYEGRPADQGYRPETPVATVTLLRNGQPIDVLTVRSETCERFDPRTGAFTPYECGPYRGAVSIEAGATYTLRAEVEGLPPAEATVEVPRRPMLAVTEEPTGPDAPRRFRVRLGDPAGAGDLYGLSLLREFTYATTISCDPETGVCRDTTVTERFPTAFDTSDPVLLAAAAEIDGNISFVTFTDETFDSEVKEFTLSADARYGPDVQDRGFTVQVAAMSGDIYDTYRITYFGGGDENPFAEPVNLPSNVEGGYGLVGGITLAEVAFEDRE